MMFVNIVLYFGSKHSVFSGPDLSKFTNFRDNPDLVNEESDRITKLIQGKTCKT